MIEHVLLANSVQVDGSTVVSITLILAFISSVIGLLSYSAGVKKSSESMGEFKGTIMTSLNSIGEKIQSIESNIKDTTSTDRKYREDLVKVQVELQSTKELVERLTKRLDDHRSRLDNRFDNDYNRKGDR